MILWYFEEAYDGKLLRERDNLIYGKNCNIVVRYFLFFPIKQTISLIHETTKSGPNTTDYIKLFQLDKRVEKAIAVE